MKKLSFQMPLFGEDPSDPRREAGEFVTGTCGPIRYSCSPSTLDTLKEALESLEGSLSYPGDSPPD